MEFALRWLLFFAIAVAATDGMELRRFSGEYGSLLEIGSNTPAFSSENEKNRPKADPKVFGVAPKIEGNGKKDGDDDDAPPEPLAKGGKAKGKTGKEFNMGEAFYDDDPDAAIKKDIDFEKIEKDRKYKELIAKKKKSKKHKKHKKEPEPEKEEEQEEKESTEEGDDASSASEDSADDDDGKKQIQQKIKKILKIQKKKSKPAAAAPKAKSVSDQMKLLLEMMNGQKAAPTPAPAAKTPMQMLQQMLASSKQRENGKINQIEASLMGMLHPNATKIIPVEPRLKQSAEKGGSGLGALSWPTVQSFVEAKEKQTNARLDALSRHFEEVINSTHHATEKDNRQMQERMSVVGSVMTELKTVASALQQLKWDMNQQGGPALPEFSESRGNYGGRRGPGGPGEEEDGYEEEEEGDEEEGDVRLGGYDEENEEYPQPEGGDGYPAFRQVQKRKRRIKRRGRMNWRSREGREGREGPGGAAVDSIDKLLSTINTFPNEKSGQKLQLL